MIICPQCSKPITVNQLYKIWYNPMEDALETKHVDCNSPEAGNSIGVGKVMRLSTGGKY